MLRTLLGGVVEETAEKENSAYLEKFVKRNLRSIPLPLVRPKEVLPLKRPEFEGQAAKPEAKPKINADAVNIVPKEGAPKPKTDYVQE